MSEYEENGSQNEQYAAEVVLVSNVETNGVGESEHDEVRKEDAILSMLCPKVSDGQRARIGSADEPNVTPVVVENRVYGEPVYEPERQKDPKNPNNRDSDDRKIAILVTGKP